MQKLITLLTLSLLLTACNGPQTVDVNGSALSYDSSTWEYFSNESGTGLNMKADSGCWIDLTGDLTTPLASEGLEASKAEGYSLYFTPGSSTASYVSFDLGVNTLYGRVGYESPEACVTSLMNLAAAN